MTETVTDACFYGGTVSFDAGANVDWVKSSAALSLQEGIRYYNDGHSIYADCPPYTISDYLRITNLGLNLPADATVTHVTIRLNHRQSGTTANAAWIDVIMFQDAEGTTSNYFSSGALGQTYVLSDYGGAVGNWNQPAGWFNPTRMNNSSFAILLRAANTGATNNRTCYVEFCELRVSYTYPTLNQKTISATTSVTLALTDQNTWVKTQSTTVSPVSEMNKLNSFYKSLAISNTPEITLSTLSTFYKTLAASISNELNMIVGRFNPQSILTSGSHAVDLIADPLFTVYQQAVSSVSTHGISMSTLPSKTLTALTTPMVGLYKQLYQLLSASFETQTSMETQGVLGQIMEVSTEFISDMIEQVGRYLSVIQEIPPYLHVKGRVYQSMLASVVFNTRIKRKSFRRLLYQSVVNPVLNAQWFAKLSMTGSTSPEAILTRYQEFKKVLRSIPSVVRTIKPSQGKLLRKNVGTSALLTRLSTRYKTLSDEIGHQVSIIPGQFNYVSLTAESLVNSSISRWQRLSQLIQVSTSFNSNIGRIKTIYKTIQASSSHGISISSRLIVQPRETLTAAIETSASMTKEATHGITMLVEKAFNTSIITSIKRMPKQTLVAIAQGLGSVSKPFTKLKVIGASAGNSTNISLYQQFKKNLTALEITVANMGKNYGKLLKSKAFGIGEVTNLQQLYKVLSNNVNISSALSPSSRYYKTLEASTQGLVSVAYQHLVSLIATARGQGSIGLDYVLGVYHYLMKIPMTKTMTVDVPMTKSVEMTVPMSKTETVKVGMTKTKEFAVGLTKTIRNKIRSVRL
jgi:hypothetical protein